jgi:hypothetical protein
VHLIDLVLSFILFALGGFLISRGKFRDNLWIVVLTLVFFPIALYTYYSQKGDIPLFGDVTLLQLLLFPFVKILILLALIRYMLISRGKGT